MIKNSLAVSTALEQRATVLVADASHARRVRHAYALAALERGSECWPRPDVLSLGAWFARELAAERADGRLQGRILGGCEEWLTWRDAVQAVVGDEAPFGLDALIDPLRRASFLVDEWQLPLRIAVSAESSLLLRARERVAERLRALHALTADRWAARHATAGDSRMPICTPVASLRLAGLEPLGPGLAAALRAAGAGPLTDADPGGHGIASPVGVAAFASVEDEFQAAAEWARQWLHADARAQLLIVVPDLAQHCGRLRRLFDATLEPLTLLRGEAASGIHDLQYVSGAAGSAIAQTALLLLQLCHGSLSLAELGILLRSGYWGRLHQARALLDGWLRSIGLLQADRPALEALAGQAPAELRPALAEVVAAIAGVQPGSANSRDWADHWVEALRAAGWPGARPLGEFEQLLRQSFETGLSDFAMHGGSQGAMNAASALRLLRLLLQRAGDPQPARPAPISFSASFNHPLLHYDGIWVCGMTDSRFPEAARPDPFIPLALQRAAGIETCTHEGQLRRARRCLQQWQACAGELRLSWAERADDLEQQASPLLAEFSATQPSRHAPSPAGYLLTRRQAEQQEGALRPGADGTPAPLPAGPVAGGVRVLELQSQCPFRAFAELRLGARELDEPAPGLNVLEQGWLLHDGLHRLWKRIADSAALQALAGDVERWQVRDAADAAVATYQRRRRVPLPGILWQLEADRIAELLRAELQAERDRAPFRVHALEAQAELDLAGAALALRIDRVDELETGGLAIIDYKSGQAVAFAADAQPPTHPQLLAYASALGEQVRALATLHVRSDGLSWRGIEAAAGCLLADRSLAGQDESVAAAHWPARRAAWQANLVQLLHDYRAGAAPVSPSARACDTCTLAALCRIRRLPPAERTDQDDE